MFFASAHKFNGPKGIGFLYVRRGTSLVPYADGGAQERKLRAGTENIASIVGMAAALKENCANLADNFSHVLRLERALLNQLDVLGVRFIRNGREHQLPSLLSRLFAGADGEEMLHCLKLMGICISTGSACDSSSTNVSHVLQAIGLESVLAQGTIRISLGISVSVKPTVTS